MKVAKNIALGSSRIVLIFFVIVICYEKNNLKKKHSHTVKTNFLFKYVFNSHLNT